MLVSFWAEIFFRNSQGAHFQPVLSPSCELHAVHLMFLHVHVLSGFPLCLSGIHSNKHVAIHMAISALFALKSHLGWVLDLRLRNSL